MTARRRHGGRTWVAWAAVLACAAGVSAQVVVRQARPVVIKGPQVAPIAVAAVAAPAAGAGGTTLVSVDADFQRALASAQRYIAQGEFDSAAEVLQSLLSRPDAGFAATDERGRYGAMTSRVNETLASMGEQGLSRYRMMYDSKAAAILHQAAEQGDSRLLGQVAREYLHTRSGPAALDALGDLRFDQGRFDAAARYWQQAAALGEEALRPCRLGKRVVALRLAGQEAEARALADEIAKQYPGATATLGGREWKLPEFLAFASALAPATAQARTVEPQGEWLGTGRGQSLAGMSDCDVVPSPQWSATQPAPPAAPSAPAPAGAVAKGSPAAEDVPLMAMRPWLQRPNPGGFSLQVVRKGGHILARWRGREGRVDGTIGFGAAQDLPLVSAIDPLVVGDLVICRRDDAVAAYDLTGGRTGEAGRMVWTSLPLPVSGAGGGAIAPYAWFVDASGYSITSDGRRAFVVGRLPGAIATSRPAEPMAAEVRAKRMAMGMMTPEDEPSALAALSLEEEGKVLWAIGGGTGDAGDEALRWARFPSAPAVQGGRLYAAAIINSTIHLVCLDTSGALVWKVPIAESTMGNAMVRRYRPQTEPMGASIALAEGMVFLCSNSGVLACVDAESGQALWARQYVDSEALLRRAQGQIVARPGGLGGGLNPLLVLDGKVVCLPGDAALLMAVSAADGKLLWTKPSNGQTELSAIDSRRVLLSSPGLTVVDVATGTEVFNQADLGLRGRPAAGPKAVLASGQGQFVRMDLKDYAISRMNLASPEAMLGNLVAVGGKLVSANAAGLCLYVNYDDCRGDMDRRVAAAQGGARAKALLDRGRLSCHAGRYEEALADLKAALEAGGEPDVADAAREWLMRTYVARGDRRERALDMVSDFQLAYDAAGTPARQAQMLVRLAKGRQMAAAQAAASDASEKLDLLRQAVQAAHQLAEAFPGAKVVDVPVGPAAVSLPPDTPAPADGRAWAMETFLPPLLKANGRACYAAWDAQADQALAKALAADDLAGMLAVRDRWPNSMHVSRSLIAAGECLYRRQAAAGAAADEQEWERAYSLLADAEDRSDPRLAVTSLAGRALIATRRASSGPLGWILAQQIRDVCAGANIPLAEPVAFNQSTKPLQSLLEELGGADPVQSPPPAGPPAFLSGPLEPLFTIKGDICLVRDQAWQGVRVGTNVLAIREDKLLWLDTAAPAADKALRWEAKVPVNLQSLRNYMPGAPGFSLVGGLTADGKTLLVADRSWATALNVADGSPRWKEPVNLTTLMGNAPGVHSLGVANDRLFVLNHRARITCLGADGAVAWTTDLSKELARFDSPPQIAGGLVLLYGTNWTKAACLDLRTGKLRGAWSSNAPLTARALPCGLTAVLADGVCSLYSMAGTSPAARAIWTRPFDAGGQPGIVGADRDRLFVSPNLNNPTLEVIRLDNKPLPSIKLEGVGGPVCAVQASEGFLYLTVGRNIHGMRSNLYVGQLVVSPMSVHKVDAATGREVWKGVTPLANTPTTASFPITPAGPNVAVTIGGPAFGYGMNVFLLGASDGRRVQTIELAGPPQPKPNARPEDFARRRSLGQAMVLEARLCAEDTAGITVYRAKDAPAPQKP